MGQAQSVLAIGSQVCWPGKLTLPNLVDTVHRSREAYPGALLPGGYGRCLGRHDRGQDRWGRCHRARWGQETGREGDRWRITVVIVNLCVLSNLNHDQTLPIILLVDAFCQLSAIVRFMLSSPVSYSSFIRPIRLPAGLSSSSDRFLLMSSDALVRDFAGLISDQCLVFLLTRSRPRLLLLTFSLQAAGSIRSCSGWIFKR